MEDDGRMDAVARCFMGEVVLFQYTWAPNGCEKRFCVASGYAAVRKRLKAKSRCGAESRESDPQQLHAGLLLLLQQPHGEIAERTGSLLWLRCDRRLLGDRVQVCLELLQHQIRGEKPSSTPIPVLSWRFSPCGATSTSWKQ